MNAVDSNNQENLQHVVENDEIDIGQLIRTIWSGRGLILGVSLGFFLLVGIFFGLRFLTFNELSKQDIQINFPFSEAEKGTYPNGTSFQLSDIISTQILGIVHQKHNLFEKDISLGQFTANISIQPDAINRSFIDAKYKARLSSKGLSQAEIEELESNYKAELTTASHRSAILSYSYGKMDLILHQQIGRILFDILDTWANIAVSQHGVLMPPSVDKKALTSAVQLQTEDFLVGVALMKDDVSRILSAAKLITDNERLSLIQDPISGLSIVGLVSRLHKFTQYHLDPLSALITIKSIYRDVDSVGNFLKSQLQTLEDQTDEIDRNISIFSDAYRENLVASRDYGIGLQLPTGTQTETQIGDAFLGQLLKLGDELSESTFRQYLLEEQIKLKLQREEISTQIIKIKRQISGLYLGNGDANEVLEYEPYDAIIKEFSSLTDDYYKIVGLVRKHVLSNNGALYESLNSTARVTNFDKIQLKRVIVAALVALILGGMVGTFITLLRKAGRSRTR